MKLLPNQVIILKDNLPNLWKFYIMKMSRILKAFVAPKPHYT